MAMPMPMQPQQDDEEPWAPFEKGSGLYLEHLLRTRNQIFSALSMLRKHWEDLSPNERKERMQGIEADMDALYTIVSAVSKQGHVRVDDMLARAEVGILLEAKKKRLMMENEGISQEILATFDISVSIAKYYKRMEVFDYVLHDLKLLLTIQPSGVDIYSLIMNSIIRDSIRFDKGVTVVSKEQLRKEVGTHAGG